VRSPNIASVSTWGVFPRSEAFAVVAVLNIGARHEASIGMAAWAEGRLRDDDAERPAEAADARKGVATVTCATGQVCRASQRPTSRII
jgi:hypothetical protein